MKIIYNGNSYPLKRMIINCTTNEYKFVTKAYDLKAAMLTAIIKIFPKLDKNSIYNRRLFVWKPIKKNEGIIHVFNSVFIGKNNWVCTIEHMYPACYYLMRENKYEKYCHKLKMHILKPNCKALLPLSEYSKDVIISKLSQYYNEEEMEIIKNKIKVLHPPQKILTTKESVHKKYAKLEKLKICFVGRDFWRKGGYVTYKCLSKLNEKYKNFEFIIISSLGEDNAAYCHHTKDMNEVLQNSDFVRWYKELPNEAVLEIIKECHVGVLPTYGDTYGFSVLEMQAAGCPVISCNNFALSEINTNETGWIIDIKSIVELIGNDYFDTKIAIHTEKYLFECMEKIFIDLFENIELTQKVCEQKAIESMKRIEAFHNPVNYGEKLNEIYRG